MACPPSRRSIRKWHAGVTPARYRQRASEFRAEGGDGVHPEWPDPCSTSEPTSLQRFGPRVLDRSPGVLELPTPVEAHLHALECGQSFVAGVPQGLFKETFADTHSATARATTGSAASSPGECCAPGVQ